MIRDRRRRSASLAGAPGVHAAGAPERGGGRGEGVEGWLLPWGGDLRWLSAPPGADRLLVAGGRRPLFLLQGAGGRPRDWWVARRPEGPWRPFGAEEAEAGTGAVAILDAAVVALERGSERLAALMLLSEGGRLELRLPPAWETKVALHLTEAGLGAAPLRLEAAGLGDEVLFLLRPRPSPGPGKTADPRQLLCLGSLSIDGELRLPLQPLEGFDPERSGLAVCAGRVYLVLARPEEPVEIRTRAAGPWPGSAWRPGAPLPGSERLPRGHWAVSRRHPDGGGGETLAVWRSGGGALVWRLAEAEGVWELRPVDELLAGAWLRVAPPLRGHADWEGSWLPRAACGTIQELPIVLPDIPG